MSFDINIGDQYDLTRRCVLDLIQGWITSGMVLGTWLGTPCTSWSRARHGPPGTSWCTIRSAAHIVGVPGLQPHDISNIQLGSSTLRPSILIIKTCLSVCVPIYFENPHTSFLWYVPAMAKLLRHSSAVSHVFDFCALGARWRKRSRLVGWSVPSSPCGDLTLCCGRKGLCSFSGKVHIMLTGRAPVQQLWTAIAEPYPRRLALLGAQALVAASTSLHEQYRSRLAGL